MTFHALKWLHACRRADLPLGARALASVLVPRSDKDGATPDSLTQAALANDVDATERSVRRWLRELEAAGLVTATRKGVTLTMPATGHSDPVESSANRTQRSGSTGHHDPVGENEPDTAIRSDRTHGSGSTGHSDPVPPHPPNRISPSSSPSSSPTAPAAPDKLDSKWTDTGDRKPLPVPERADHAWLQQQLNASGVRGVLVDEARYVLAYFSQAELAAACRVAKEGPAKFRLHGWRSALTDVAIPPTATTTTGRPRKGLPVPVASPDYLKDNPWA